MQQANLARIAVAVALLLVQLLLLARDADAQVVQTQYGAVHGTTEDGVNVFHSIPFAAPPVGQLRFAPPKAPAAWSGVKNVSSMPNVCPQMRLSSSDFLGNEDCLYLHVYVPANATAKSNLPVMVWIYGGAYILGDGYEFGMYDGKNLARNNDVIVVSANYRVGAFGFWASPGLQSEDPDGRVGNMALLDQRFAMQWVQANIANFGGDPKRVTIFGESAGGFSVCWHLVSPGSAGLFQAAIMESGSCDSTAFFQPLQDAFAYSANYSSAIGCTGTPAQVVSCMRAATTAEIMNSPSIVGVRAAAQRIQDFTGLPPVLAERAASVIPALAPIMPFGPAIDGVDLPDVPLRLLQKGAFNKVPTIFGSNAQEGNLFVPLIEVIVPGTHFPPTDDDLVKAMVHLLGGYSSNSTLLEQVVAQAVAHYPLANYTNSPWYRAGAMLTDFFFTCGTRRSARAIAAADVDIWLYYFTYPASNWIDYDLMGDYHSIELTFVWNNPVFLLHEFTAEEQSVADGLGTYWTNMAVGASPNARGSNLAWPQYKAPAYTNLNVSWPFSTQSGCQASACDLWDSIMARVVT